jgi:hypothetical protein
MTTTHNPQAAADQARAAYRKVTDQLGHLGLDTAVPKGVRALAEKTVAQRPARRTIALSMLSRHP